jgi:hypothetical protein
MTTILKSSCSCNKINNDLTTNNFNIISKDLETKCCQICKNSLNDYCFTHEYLDNHMYKIIQSVLDDYKCKIVQSISCDHKYHFCCISRWLKDKTQQCPICHVKWELLNQDNDKIIIYFEDKVLVYFEDKVEKFYSLENINYQLRTRFNIDMTKYMLSKIKFNKYSLCSLDSHSTKLIEIKCSYKDNIHILYFKYSTKIQELKDTISRVFKLVNGDLKIFFNNIRLIDKYNLLNLYNLNIQDSSTLIIEFDEIPHEFICPISLEIMSDPVILEDGFSYQRDNIMKWLLNNNTSPMTRQCINTSNILDNVPLKTAIDEFLFTKN